MSSILLKNLTVSDQQVDLLISKGLIQKIEPASSCLDWDLAGDFEVMDCSGKVGIPGFVNMHTHAGMTLLRGIGEDMVFHDWIKKIWKAEECVDPEFVYWSTKVACLEMIKTGTTTYNDQYWYFPSGRQAALDMGLRSALGYDFLDRFDKNEAERQKDQCIRWSEEALKWNNKDCIYVINIHSIYTVSEESILWATQFARKNGLRIQIHLSETKKEVDDCIAEKGITPVEYLDRLGVLGPDVIAAHTLWVDEKDIEILGKRGVHCVHNINSNAKVCSGFRFKYNELRDAGVNVCIGTDSCASSNNLDILEAMKTSALFQKVWRNDPQAMPLDELLNCATINGAKALGINSGELKVGKVADISIIDTDNSFFLSPGPFLANLVYSAHSDCVDSVICNGRFVMRERVVPNEKETLHEARKMLAKINTH